MRGRLELSVHPGRILNLGCGTRTTAHPGVVNIDWSIYLRLRRNPVSRRLAPLFLSGTRRERFRSLPANILAHDLSQGIPFADESVDAVYHSHMLEHLDRGAALVFQREVLRVLRPGGIERIVVPDFENVCRTYLAHLDDCEAGQREPARHDDYVALVLEQSVRREAVGATEQSPLRRVVDTLLLGDARKRGETHQWMYDHVNLREMLRRAGFQNVVRQSHDSSLIPGWNEIGLDLVAGGAPYKPHSLYMEAVR